MRVSKWGNSLAVRLPKKLVEDLGLKPGDELTIVEAKNGTVAIEKAERRQHALDEIGKFRWKLPEGYKFDRDEANER